MERGSKIAIYLLLFVFIASITKYSKVLTLIFGSNTKSSDIGFGRLVNDNFELSKSLSKIAFQLLSQNDGDKGEPQNLNISGVIECQFADPDALKPCSIFRRQSHDTFDQAIPLKSALMHVAKEYAETSMERLGIESKILFDLECSHTGSRIPPYDQFDNSCQLTMPRRPDQIILRPSDAQKISDAIIKAANLSGQGNLQFLLDCKTAKKGAKCAAKLPDDVSQVPAAEARSLLEQTGAQLLPTLLVQDSKFSSGAPSGNPTQLEFVCARPKAAVSTALFECSFQIYQNQD